MNGLQKPQPFEKPMGFRDYPPQWVRKRREIEKRIQACFSQWGYQEIVTPTLEFYDTVGKASAIPEQKMFKCMDRNGNTLVLRPDYTAPIARVVASILQDQPLPLRLSYHANVFRAQENEAGRSAEFYQSGVELIGLSHAEADAEVITLAIEALQACQVPKFRLSIGHVGLMKAWIEERISDQELVRNLNTDLEQRNMVDFRQRIESLDAESATKEELLALLHISTEPFAYFRAKTSSKIVVQALSHLEEIWDSLRDWGVLSSVTFDPTLTGSLHYYTGITFEGYAASSGFPLLSGGRYDQLLNRFGRNLPATGFALKMNRLMESSTIDPEISKGVTICYPTHLRKEAYHKAQALRQQGKAVTLQVDDSNPTNSQISVWEEGRKLDG